MIRYQIVSVPYLSACYLPINPDDDDVFVVVGKCLRRWSSDKMHEFREDFTACA